MKRCATALLRHLAAANVSDMEGASKNACPSIVEDVEFHSYFNKTSYRTWNGIYIGATC